MAEISFSLLCYETTSFLTCHQMQVIFKLCFALHFPKLHIVVPSLNFFMCTHMLSFISSIIQSQQGKKEEKKKKELCGFGFFLY